MVVTPISLSQSINNAGSMNITHTILITAPLVRDLLNATVQLRDGKKITEMNPTLLEKIPFKAVLKKIEGTDIEKLLKEYNVI